MSPAERQLWLRVQRRASLLQPALAAAMLRAFAALRDDMGETALTRALETSSEEVFRVVLSAAVLDAALQPVRERLRRTIADAVPYFARTLPPPPTSLGRTVSIGFNILNPRVIDAVRTLETRVMTTLAEDARESVRQRIRAGVEAGKNPRAIARTLTDAVGLAPNQELAVRNFEAALRGEGRNPLDYALRDKRFDATVQRIAKGSLTEAQIERMVSAYRRKMVAFNTETIARTATLDALKLGQRLSWEASIENGYVDGTKVQQRWVGVLDDRERPTHRAMEGTTVRFDAPFILPDGQQQTIPGDGEYNCRCIARYFVARD